MNWSVLVPPRISDVSNEIPGNIVRLAEYDLWMSSIKNVHVISQVLDIERFCTSLAVACGIYRHTCGRLQSDASDWKIKLADAPIPVEIVYSTSIPGIRGDWVVQDDITPLMHSFRGSVVNADTSLLRLRLTISSEADKSAIGVTWHHTLGDATALLRFMGLLSAAYQDMEGSFTFPTFSRYLFPVSTSHDMETFRSLMPHLAEACSGEDLAVKSFQRNRYTVRIEWIIPRDKADALQTRIRESTEEAVSLQDCLSAYIVTLLNRCGKTPINKITNAASYRCSKNAYADINLAGNQIFIVPTDTILAESTNDIRAITRIIRASLTRSRSSAWVEGYMSVASAFMLSAAREGHHFFFGAEPSTLSVNSQISLDWKSITFGAETSHYFTAGTSKYYLRVFNANNDSMSIGDLDISFGVPAHLESRVLSTLRNDLESCYWPDNVILTE